MLKPNKVIFDAIKVTVHGAGTVLLSTVTSCALAVVIERSAHRTLYHFFPHKYDDVEYANGLPHLQHRNKGAKSNSSNQNADHVSQIECPNGLQQGSADNSNAISNPLHLETTTLNERDEPVSSIEELFLRRNNHYSISESSDSKKAAKPSPNDMNVTRKSNEWFPERPSEIMLSCAMTAG